MVDQVIAYFNASASFIIAAVMTVGILSQKFEDGVVIKSGLILMVIGFFITGFHLIDGIDCPDLLALNRARAMTNIGMIVAIVGYLFQARKGKSVADLIHVKTIKDALRKI